MTSAAITAAIQAGENVLFMACYSAGMCVWVNMT